MSIENPAKERTGPAGGLLPQIDWASIPKSPGFKPAVAVFVGICLAFWTLMSFLPGLWKGDEYYSHGFLVPFLTAFVIYRWWPWLPTAKPGKPFFLIGPTILFGAAAFATSGAVSLLSYGLLAVCVLLWIVWAFATLETSAGLESATGMGLRIVAALLLAGTLALVWVSSVNQVYVVLSAAFLLALWFATAFVAGWRYAWFLTLPIFLLAFALPVWQPVINEFTNPLQVISAQTAVQLLKALGFELYQMESTKIVMGNGFLLDVGVPCSGLKLIIALVCFTLLFMMIGGLKWWANLVMASIVVPLAIFINGLRIALIGVVGDTYGSDAGMKFHDYSGYITLIVCFILLFKIARLIGWKD